ncbi:universal stress protein [Parvularcula mediterranea]|nr:universal stress protein [Parvularcula mediterranea]
MSHLLLHTDADVLLVRSKESGPYRSIVIAWDGSKDLQSAIERTRVYAPAADIAVFLSVSLSRELAAGEDKLRRALTAAGLSPADFSVHVSADGLLTGLREALREENADLLVLPTRGSQGGDLGYVASEILSQRFCDTLCLHRRV